MRRAAFPTRKDLRWVDGLVKSIRPHVHVRRKDNLLILMPNEAYRLNETGVHLLVETLAGKRINRVVDDMIPKPNQGIDTMREIHDFFCAIRALVMGCMGEGRGWRAVEQTPFQRGDSELPVLSEIAVTYKCNLSCKFCYAGCTCKSKPSDYEMSAGEVRKVLSKIRGEAEVPSVSFTGGEPTLRSDIFDLIRHACKVGLRVNLITNGTLITPQVASRLRKSGLRSAQVSVEGPCAEIHDMLTGVAGSFDKALNGIRALKDEGMYVHTNTTINGLNAGMVEGMVELAKSLGLPRLSMNMVMPCGTAGTGETAFRYRDIAGLVQSVRRKARQAGIEFMWYSPTPYCMFNPIAGGLGSKSCAACNGLLSVAPNGDVLPCSSLPDPVGNLLNEDFEEIWFSEKAKAYRECRYAPLACQSCTKFDICAGACPIYWNAFGCEELEGMAV